MCTVYSLLALLSFLTQALVALPHPIPGQVPTGIDVLHSLSNYLVAQGSPGAANAIEKGLNRRDVQADPRSGAVMTTLSSYMPAHGEEDATAVIANVLQRRVAPVDSNSGVASHRNSLRRRIVPAETRSAAAMNALSEYMAAHGEEDAATVIASGIGRRAVSVNLNSTIKGTKGLLQRRDPISNMLPVQKHVVEEKNRMGKPQNKLEWFSEPDNKEGKQQDQMEKQQKKVDEQQSKVQDYQNKVAEQRQQAQEQWKKAGGQQKKTKKLEKQEKMTQKQERKLEKQEKKLKKEQNKAQQQQNQNQQQQPDHHHKPHLPGKQKLQDKLVGNKSQTKGQTKPKKKHRSLGQKIRDFFKKIGRGIKKFFTHDLGKVAMGVVKVFGRI